MKRTLKFRAWDGKQMHLPEYSDKEDFHILPDGTVVFTREVGYERHEMTEWRGDNWTEMQFTGHADKNGVDIYEGDIMPGIDGHHYSLVVWNERNACFQINGHYTHITDEITDHVLVFGGDNELEVIGNVWQNPELMEP